MTIPDIYFKNAASLPVMPELATRLMRSLEDDNLSLGELQTLLERDPGLSAKVLRLANSARYNRRQAIASVREASQLIGLRTLRELAMAACMSGLFPDIPWFDPARLWRHGVATAGHARVMAPLCGTDPDVAYLGGLMLRTGRILMLMNDPDGVALTDNRDTGPDTLVGAERELLGYCHIDISAGLALRWNFPGELTQAITAAADPLDHDPLCKLGAVLRMASTLTDAGERQVNEMLALQSCHAALLLLQLDIDLSTLGQLILPYSKLTEGVDQLLT